MPGFEQGACPVKQAPRAHGCLGSSGLHIGLKFGQFSHPLLKGFKAAPDFCSQLPCHGLRCLIVCLQLKEQFNEVHPHSSLKMRSPREFRRQRAEQVRQEPSTDQAVYCD